MYAVGADKDHRLGWFCRPRRRGDQGVGSIQQIVVVSPRTGRRDRVETGQDPSAWCPTVDTPGPANEQDSRCGAGLRHQRREDVGVNSGASDGVDLPGTRMFQEQPATRRGRRTGQRIGSCPRCVRASERRVWFTHSAMAKPASSRRRARSRPRSPAVTTPLASSALSGPTSSSATRSSPARLRTRIRDPL